MRNGDKGEVADDLRQVFRTGDRNYTVEKAWGECQAFCEKWGKYYRGIRKRRQDPSYKAYFTHVSELRPPHPSDDIHDQLDRETPEGLPEGDEDARGDAKRRVCTAAYGQDRHGQEVIPEADAENRSRQDPIPGLMKTAEVKLPRLLYFQTKLIHLQSLKNLRTQNGHTK